MGSSGGLFTDVRNLVYQGLVGSQELFLKWRIVLCIKKHGFSSKP